jgi:hypothetical protein
MTDLEATRLCAEAMEAPPDLPGASEIWSVSISYATGTKKKVSHWVKASYNPLENDAQAMALVKRFRLRIRSFKEALWEASTDPREDNAIDVLDPDLNRAIVYCVAALRGASSSNRAPSE